ncbi:uncharacterized protein LOC135472922 [Liolophura sinensis]|uniref:uncharacterized protein LOC135472922 n=1 Tax=Liolophura sinensis TaxID=3198878 RepID=UPI00315874ED
MSTPEWGGDGCTDPPLAHGMTAELGNHERCSTCRKAIFNKLYHCKHCSGRCKRRCKHSGTTSCRRCARKRTKRGETHWSKVLQANEVNSNFVILPCADSCGSFHVEVSDICTCNMKGRVSKDGGVLSNLYERFCQWLLSKKKNPTPTGMRPGDKKRNSRKGSGLGIDLGYVSFDEVVLNSPIETNREFSFSRPYTMSSSDSCSCCSYSTTSSLSSATFGIALADGQVTDIVDSLVQSGSSERSAHFQDFPIGHFPEAAAGHPLDEPSANCQEAASANFQDPQCLVAGEQPLQEEFQDEVFLPVDKFWSLQLSRHSKINNRARERRHTSLTTTLSCPHKTSSKSSTDCDDGKLGLALCSTWPLLAYPSQEYGPPDEVRDEVHVYVDELSEQFFNPLSRRQASNLSDSLGDCTIPFADLEFGECIRSGRRQQIHRGRWHGDVIIHTFRDLDDEEVKFFLREVSNMSMIRHDNITLFMGACLEPPTLAVVSGLSRRPSLYESIHIKGEKMQLHMRVQIIRQIAQAMGYLHAKGIILRRLNTKNIFLEPKVKISIMDHGMSQQKCDRSDKGCIPKGHLTYIAPELLRTVRVEPPRLRTDETFTRETDVFAFGTVMYEVFAGHFPYSDLPPDVVIYQVGKGYRQPLSDLNCLSFVKDLIKDCWTHDSLSRPEFCEITKGLIHNAALHKRHSSSEPEGINRSGFRNRSFFT